ncbi:MAG: hypothetical protein ABSA52_16905 [Candidatus Binatia bacterium]|jgi:hypothetical protein
MKLADRFRVLQVLDCLARERVRLSILRGELTLVPSGEVSAYAKSLCRELSEAYEDHPNEVREMITGRRAAWRNEIGSADTRASAQTAR